MPAEVVMNLWVFTQSVSPGVLFPEFQRINAKMNVIYGLGVRAYMMSGTDDEMTALLKQLSVSDFHLSHRFPLPERYYIQVKLDSGQFRAASGDHEPDGGRVRRGVALVRPDIAGMHQLEYFTEALDVVENSLPKRSLGIRGIEIVPRVNRKNLFSVITTVNVDDNGNQVARVEHPHRHEPTATVANLWAFRSETHNAIYELSGRPYMVHGPDADRARILKALAANDFAVARTSPVPAAFATDFVAAPAWLQDAGGEAGIRVLPVSSANTYSNDLFRDILRSFGQEVPPKVGIGGINNPMKVSAEPRMLCATQITDRADNTCDATPLSLTGGAPETSSHHPKDAPVLKVSLCSKEGSVSRVGDKYRYRIRVEGDNASTIPLGWSGVTINVPTINSRDQYSATEFEMSSMECDPPSRYGPGDQIWGFRNDGSFGEKVATSLLMECVRKEWPPHKRIALEVALTTACPRLDIHVRVWSTRPDNRDGFGDPAWQTPTQRDQQGIPVYPMTLKIGIWDHVKHLFRARPGKAARSDAKPAQSAHPKGSFQPKAPQHASAPAETCDKGHDWNGCTCRRCKARRPGEENGLLNTAWHDWNNNECRRCGQRRRAMTVEYR